MHHCVVVAVVLPRVVRLVNQAPFARRWGRPFSFLQTCCLTVKRRQGSCSASVDRNSSLLDASEVVLDVLVARVVLAEGILVQIRLQAEYFLRDLLVFPLNALQLRLPLVEMQTLRFEFNAGHRLTLSQPPVVLRWQVDCSLLASRYLYELFEQFLVVPLDLRLLDRLLVLVHPLLVSEEPVLVVACEVSLRSVLPLCDAFKLLQVDLLCPIISPREFKSVICL